VELGVVGLGSHAPETMLHPKGRRIAWHWVPDHFYGRRDELIVKRGWSGTMTLPRVLTMGDGVLHFEPVEELNSLRYNPVELADLSVASGSSVTLSEVSGDTMELEVIIEPGDAEEYGLKVRCSPDGSEEMGIVYNAEKQTLTIEMSKSSSHEVEDYRTIESLVAPLELKSGEPLHLRIFLDRSIMEVYANKRQCVTQRIYPTREDSQGVVLFSRGGDMNVSMLNAWDMHPSNPW
jgi:beta-fructofuranosidase